MRVEKLPDSVAVATVVLGAAEHTHARVSQRFRCGGIGGCRVRSQSDSSWEFLLFFHAVCKDVTSGRVGLGSL